MNVGDINTRIKRTFGDESGVQVTDADIIRWVNDGQRQIVMNNENLFEKTQTIASVPGQGDYALPVDTLILRGISYRGPGGAAYLRLTGFSLNEFNEYIDGWDGNAYNQGVPTAFMVYAGKITLFPIPDHSLPTALKVYYNSKPIDVTTALSDVPSIPEIYHESLVKYCLMQAYEMDEDWQASSAKSQQMEGDLKILRGRDDWKREETYPVITVKVEDQF